jgi:peptidylprolyl isomerase
MTRRAPLLFLALIIGLGACSSDSSTVASESVPTTSTVASASVPSTVDEPTESTGPEPSAEGKPEVVIADGPAPVELEIDDLIDGTGKIAAAGDYLVMHYVGVRHSDGGQFDASWDRGATFSFILGGGRVIQGWDQGIVGMKAGGRRQLSIPADLAYGDQARGEDIPANSALVFVVDLIAVATPPDIENAPEPVTELEVVVLEDGDGEVIEAGMTVELHYRAILQTNGEVFASSWDTGEPAVFEVAAEPSQSIPAWDEGLVGRRVGDTIRMVIPPGLGVADQTGQIPADATIITELTILGTR